MAVVYYQPRLPRALRRTLRRLARRIGSETRLTVHVRASTAGGFCAYAIGVQNGGWAWPPVNPWHRSLEAALVQLRVDIAHHQRRLQLARTNDPAP